MKTRKKTNTNGQFLTQTEKTTPAFSLENENVPPAGNKRHSGRIVDLCANTRENDQATFVLPETKKKSVVSQSLFITGSSVLPRHFPGARWLIRLKCWRRWRRQTERGRCAVNDGRLVCQFSRRHARCRWTHWYCSSSPYKDTGTQFPPLTGDHKMLSNDFKAVGFLLFFAASKLGGKILQSLHGTCAVPCLSRDCAATSPCAGLSSRLTLFSNVNISACSVIWMDFWQVYFSSSDWNKRELFYDKEVRLMSDTVDLRH